MISFVVPVMNEEESLEAFYAELSEETSKLKEKYEILLIDDGSTDHSLEILKNLEEKDSRVRIYSFRKNHGKAEALMLGFQKSAGDIVITLDADLQDLPSEVKNLLEKHKKDGTEVISGWRKHRKDASKMIVISRIFNNVIGEIFDLRLHDYNCGLKLYTSEAAKSLRLYGGLHRFIPLLAYQQGFSVDEIEVQHQERKFGKSKYQFTKIKDLPDIFTMIFLTKYGKRPLHFFGTIGGGMLTVGLLIFLYLSVIWLMGESIGRRPLLIFSVLLMLAGLQVFFTGFIAELIINLTHKEHAQFPLKYSSERE